MPAAVKLREDFSAGELRALARRSKDVNQSRRLLSLAAVAAAALEITQAAANVQEKASDCRPAVRAIGGRGERTRQST